MHSSPPNGSWPKARPDGQLTTEEVRPVVLALKDIPQVLADAEVKRKATLNSEMGVAITYEPGTKVVIAQVRPACRTERVGGGT